MLLSKILESLKTEIDNFISTQNIVKKKIEIDYRRLQIIESLFNKNSADTIDGLKKINTDIERLRDHMLTLMKNHYKPKQVVPKALESYYKEIEKEKMLSVTLPQLGNLS